MFITLSNDNRQQRNVILLTASILLQMATAYSNAYSTASAKPLVNAVRNANGGPARVSRRACALAAVTVAVEYACAASCKALVKAGK